MQLFLFLSLVWEYLLTNGPFKLDIVKKADLFNLNIQTVVSKCLVLSDVLYTGRVPDVVNVWYLFNNKCIQLQRQSPCKIQNRICVKKNIYESLIISILIFKAIIIHLCFFKSEKDFVTSYGAITSWLPDYRARKYFYKTVSVCVMKVITI